MIKGNRNVLDPTGWTATILEWYALWWVAADESVSPFQPKILQMILTLFRILTMDNLKLTACSHHKLSRYLRSSAQSV